jgi:RIO-like serine/threonine protein kinase
VLSFSFGCAFSLGRVSFRQIKNKRDYLGQERKSKTARGEGELCARPSKKEIQESKKTGETI